MLSYHGFGANRRVGRTPSEKLEEIQMGRDHMLHDESVGEFIRAIAFLNGKPKRKTINKSCSSYSLKHKAEMSFGDFKGGSYVSNGMFIAAALHLGFSHVRSRGDGQNAHFNIGRVSWRYMIGCGAR